MPGRPAAIFAPALGSALLALASTAEIGLGPLCFVALTPLLVALDRGPTTLRAGMAGWLAGTAFFCAALAWVPLAGHGAAASALTFAYAVVLATSWGAFSATLAWLRARDRRLFLAAAPALWVRLEVARSSGAFGNPWHLLGYALADWPELLGPAALGGVALLSLWIVAVNVAWSAARAEQPGSTRAIAAIAIAGMLLLVPPLLSPGGAVRERGRDGSAAPLRIAAVQPLAWQPAAPGEPALPEQLRDLVDLTRDAAAQGAELVVWPESAFALQLRAGSDPFLAGVARQYDLPLLTGVWRRVGGSHLLYNSAALVGAGGGISVVGDKVRLIPFGERAAVSGPERALARAFGTWPGRFVPGARAGLVELPGGPRERSGRGRRHAGVLICHDSSFPDIALDLRRRGADLLVELSNDAPTSLWSARIHAAVSRLRAIETGLPLLRAANTGPSEWVDPSGRVVARIPADVRGVWTAAPGAARPATPFVHYGHAPVLLAGLLPIVAFGLSRLRAAITLEKEPCLTRAPSSRAF